MVMVFPARHFAVMVPTNLGYAFTIEYSGLNCNWHKIKFNELIYQNKNQL
jgi:hypothetical protein